tara:strand:+ start:3504 stop:4259 length:756 start_codon:yes stop_codon:yes gene_type:complete
MPFTDPSLVMIERLADEITEILMTTQEILVTELYQIGTTVDASQLANLNAQSIMENKTFEAIRLYNAGHPNLLATMSSFGNINEASLRALKELSTKQFMSTLNNMGDIMFNEITKGIFSGLSRDQIFRSVQNLSGFQDYQIRAMINTQFSNFSRAVTTNMIKGLPKTAKLRYVGPIDGRTRDACKEMFLGGALTKDEVQKEFGKYGDIMSNGGGWNCRHRWTWVDSGYQSASAGYDDLDQAKKAIKKDKFK